MELLSGMNCVPCRGGEPLLNDQEIAKLLLQIPEWELVVRERVNKLERQYGFYNFAQALIFTNQVGVLADAQDHHPAILTEWGKVTVTWWTYVLKGLHRNDFIMAAKTDQCFTANL